MMLRSSLMVIVLFLGVFNLVSQERVNFKTIDADTYEFYTKSDWNSLIETGRKGIQKGIDYYYLRMRMGLANYQKGRHIFASQHFIKALSFNAYDWNADYYLYNSLLFSGKRDRARKLAASFSDSQKERLGIQRNVLSGAILFGGYMFTNNYDKNTTLDLLDQDDLYAEQLLIGSQAILNAGFDVNLSTSVKLYIGYTYLTTQKKNRFQYVLDRYYRSSTTPLPGGSYQHNYNARRESHDKTFDGAISQSELYLNGKVQLSEGLAFNLFSNILFIGLDQVSASLVSSLKRDTLAYNAVEDRYLFIDFEEYDYTFRESDTSFVNWMAGFNIQKDFNFIVTALGASYARLYGDDVFQVDLVFTYYPLGNLSFYGQTGGVFLNETTADLAQRNAFSFYQMLGVKLQKKLWLEGSFHSGDLRNMHIHQGITVFNLPEKINYMTGVKLMIFVNKHVSIDLRYTLTDKSGGYLTFSAVEESILKYTKYQTHSLLGGIIWTL